MKLAGLVQDMSCVSQDSRWPTSCRILSVKSFCSILLDAWYLLSRWGRYMKSISVILGVASMACLVDCVGCRGLEFVLFHQMVAELYSARPQSTYELYSWGNRADVAGGTGLLSLLLYFLYQEMGYGSFEKRGIYISSGIWRLGPSGDIIGKGYGEGAT